MSPQGWSRTTLGAVTAPRVEQSGPNPQDDEFVYIDIGCVDVALKTIVTRQMLRTRDAPSRARQRVNAGDILVSMTRPNLNAVAVVSAEFDGAICSTGFHVLRPVLVPSSLLLAVVRSTSFIEAMTERVQGALYPAIRPDDIRSFGFDLAPEFEQTRIVAKLDAFFALTAAVRARVEQLPVRLGRANRTLLSAAFRGDLSLSWRAGRHETEGSRDVLNRASDERQRLTKQATRGQPKVETRAYESPVPFDERGVPELPPSWSWTSLDSMAWGASYGTSAKCDYDGRGEPVLRIPNVAKGTVDVTDMKRAIASIGLAADDLLKPGDFLIVRTNGSRDLIGRAACLAEGQATGCYFASYLIRFRLVEPAIGKWISLWWRSGFMRNWLETRAASSAGQYNVSMSTLAAAPIPVPPPAEMAHVTGLVEDGLEALNALSTRVADVNETLFRLEQAALAKAFRGELAPHDPNREPAEALLSRIREAREMATPGNTRPRRSRAASRAEARVSEGLSNGHAHRAGGEDALDLIVAAFQHNGKARLDVKAIVAATGLDASVVKRSIATLVESGHVRQNRKGRATAYEWTA